MSETKGGARKWLADMWWLLRYGIRCYMRTPWQVREAVQSVMATGACWSRKDFREVIEALPTDGTECWVIEAWFDGNGCGGGYMGPDHIAHSAFAKPPQWEVVPQVTTTFGGGAPLQITMRPLGGL